MVIDVYKMDLFNECYILFEDNMITFHAKNKNYKLKDDIFNCLFLKHTVIRKNRVDMLMLFIKECLEDCKLDKNYNLDNAYSLVLQFYHTVENEVKVK